MFTYVGERHALVYDELLSYSNVFVPIVIF